MKYDENVLHGEAKRLYANASGIVLLSWLFGALLGIGAFGYMFEKHGQMTGIFLGVPAMLAVVAFGSARANTYRIQAQNMLVLCQIEKNTRPTS